MVARERVESNFTLAHEAAAEDDPVAVARREGGSKVPEWNATLVISAMATAYDGARLQPGGAATNTTTIEATKATRAALAAFAPADEIEAMLSAQAFGLHGATMEALRRAAHPTIDDVATMWERAADLGRTMLATVEALDRRRAARQAKPDAPSPIAPATNAAPAGAPPSLPSEWDMSVARAARPDAPDASTLLSNEEPQQYGYRSPGPGYGYEGTEIPGVGEPKRSAKE